MFERKKVKCRNCGEYYVAFSEGHAHRRLCGKVCRLIYHKKQDDKQKAKNERRKTWERAERTRELTCEFCGKNFFAPPVNFMYGEEHPRLYCSKSCQGKAAYRRRKEREVTGISLTWEDKRLINTLQTEEQIERYKSFLREDTSQNLLEKRKNGKWETYDEYCQSDTFKKWKKAVLIKYNFKCQMCNKKATIAHHTVYRIWGTETLDDGIALCYLCHEKCHIEEPWWEKQTNSLRKRRK